MSSFAVGNFFLIGSMLCAAGSQLLIKKVLDDARLSEIGWATLQQFLVADRLLRAGAGLSMMGLGFVFWILCLARLDLAYAYPIACSSVVFVTLLSAIFLNEAVTARMWAGTALVLLGIILIGPSR